MYKLDLPLDQKEQAAIERRRNQVDKKLYLVKIFDQRCIINDKLSRFFNLFRDFSDESSNTSLSLFSHLIRN